MKKNKIIVWVCALMLISFFVERKEVLAVTAAPGGEFRACVGKSVGSSCHVDVDERGGWDGKCASAAGTLFCKNLNALNEGDNSISTGTKKCDPACFGDKVCINGACMIPSHSVSPDAPIVTNNGGGNGAITSSKIPGTTEGESVFINCGRAGQDMCTLCHLIEGMNNIIKYIMKLSIGVGILAFAIAGVLYVVSVGDPGLRGTANAAMKNTIYGFFFILGAWLIINTIILALGSRQDEFGNPTFGMNIKGWGQFDCTASKR